MASPLLAPAEVDYPSSDGRPIAESDHQRTPLTYAVERLRQYFRDREDVYVSGNLLIYYEEGNPGASVAPDVFVVVGADRRDRSSYRLWEEPKGPDFALEITSRRTHREDQGKKRELYRRLEVREYWHQRCRGWCGRRGSIGGCRGRSWRTVRWRWRARYWGWNCG